MLAYGLVGTVMFGLSYAVVRDREHYRMLKYIYISPGRFQTYFLGRGAARGLEGTVGGVLNIAVGLFLFSELRKSVGVDGPWLLVYLLIGSRDALGVRDDPRGGVPEHVAERHVPERGDRGARLPPLRRGLPHRRPAGLGAADLPEPADDLLARGDAPRAHGPPPTSIRRAARRVE